jgi:hypothetical protein
VNGPGVPLALRIGFVLLAAGLTATLWLGEWRWAVTGLVALLVCAVVVPARNRPEDTPISAPIPQSGRGLLASRKNREIPIRQS